MSTITITNLTDTPVAGETDLRQAVAEATSGELISLARADFGEFIQLNSPLVISAGKDLTIDFGAGEDNEIIGSVIVSAGATATLVNMTKFDNDVGADSPDHPANGEGGVAGQSGVDGDGTNGQNGGGGGNRASATHPGADALGAV